MTIWFFSSDISGGLLADVGVPAFGESVTTTSETLPFTIWAPSAVQAGGLSGSTHFIYHFISAEVAVPEPTTYALLGSFLLAGILVKRRKLA